MVHANPHTNQYLISEAKLNGSSCEFVSLRVMVWVPLQSHQSRLLPLCHLLGVSGEGQGEDIVKALSGDSHSQHAVLVGLGAPPTAVHHPHEVGLDP